MSGSLQASASNGRMMAIFSTPRAGSTWLGTIAASHPDIAYRFEPISRIAKISSQRRSDVVRFIQGNFDQSALASLYDILLPAYPETDKPPMFPKRYAARAARGKSQLWPLARKFRISARLYHHLYTPLDKPRLAWKEVGREPVFEALAATETVPLVYLVRHPCAVVSSLIEGQKNRLMPAGRSTALEAIVSRHDPQLAASYVPRLESLTVAEKEALLWRVDVERAMTAVRGCSQAMTIVYEDLCSRPEEITRSMFEHFDLDVHDQTKLFLEQSIRPPAKGVRRPDGWSNAYFTVYRDPIASRDKWKRKISDEDRAAVMAVVGDSHAYAYGKQRGLWE